MATCDFILICQSEAAHYAGYAGLPLERIDLYRHLVFPRMVHYRGGFRSHLDVVNDIEHGRFFDDAGPAERRGMYSIWNLPGFVGPHLANYLLEYGIVTCIINNIDAEWDRFREAYASCDPVPLVGISTTFHLSYSELSRLCKQLRAIDDRMEIVVGGAFVNAETLSKAPDSFERPMRAHGIRYVLHAFNSEKDLCDLILQRKTEGDAPEGGLESVGNLAYIKGATVRDGTFHVTGREWNAPVLDDAPAHWRRLELPFVNHTLQLRTASGCPFECAFCSYPETARGTHRMAVEHVRRHVEEARQVPGVTNLIFIDDTLNVPPDRFKELLEAMRGRDIEWFSFLRCQFIDRETARMMKEAGCVAVYLGVESANDAVLRNMNKHATREQLVRGIANLKDAGICTMAAFVLGFPGETAQTIQDDIDFVERTGVDFYTLKEFFYMAHTPVHRERARYGLTGMGAKWSHATMDSESAQAHKLEMFRQIRNSVHLDADTSLWHVAYLYDQGFTIPEIADLQRYINGMIQAQLEGRFDQDAVIPEALRRRGRAEAQPYHGKTG